MPGTLLLKDYEESNQNELQDHLQGLLSGAQNAVGGAVSGIQTLIQPPPQPVPTPEPVPEPVAPAPPPDELQAHLNNLIAAPEPTPAPELTPVPSPVDSGPPRPLQLIGEGLTSLGSGATQVHQELNDHLTSLLAPPQPTEAPPPQPALPEHDPSPPVQTPGTQIANTPDATGRVFPLTVKPDNAPSATYHSQGGSDLMAPRGTPVLNMQSGKVDEVFTDNGSHTVGGNAVLVHGDDGLDYYYAHFDQPPGVKVGQRVGAGEQIGAVGNSGNAWKGGEGATHLHIGIGKGISNGVGSEGGLGQNFNAQALLSDLQSGVGKASTAVGGALRSGASAVQTTAGLSGGGQLAGQIGDTGRQIMAQGAQSAAWLGDQGQKALQAILVTEGGLAGARGDNGKSAGPLQFYEDGQLANLARQMGMGLDQAKQWVEQNPGAAVRWAIGTPDQPGYLGRAIKAGQDAGLSGADLATYAQRVGQVSVSPERAGANYASLFSGDQPPIMGVMQPGTDTTAPPAAGFTAPPAPTAAPERPGLNLLGQGLTSLSDAATGGLKVIGDTATAAQDAVSGAARAAGGVASDVGTAASQVGQHAQELIQAPGVQGVLQPPERPVTSGAAGLLESAAQNVPPNVPGVGGALELGASLLRQPDVVEATRTVQQLNDKYAADPTAVKVGGIVLHVDPAVMTPEDRAAYNQATIAVGGITGGEAGGTRWQKMPGSAELGPVREVVPQTSSDLLQSMVDAVRERGGDPETLAALERQIGELDPTAATRRALTPGPTEPEARAGAAAGGGGSVPPGEPPPTASTGGPTPPAGGGRGPLDYEGLANLRRSTRVRQPGLPDMPASAVNPADKVIAFTVNNMLSNPASLLTNALGGAMETVKRPVVTAFSGELGPAGADLRAMGHAIGDALADSAETLATGRRAMNVIDQPEAFSGRAGLVATPFLRVMGATDEFVRTLNSAGAQGAELARLTRRNATLSQTEILDRYKQQILDAGTKAAAEATYTEGGIGLGQAIAGTRRQLTAPDASIKQRLGGAATQVLVPFSVVPDVILSRGVSRLPGINELITSPIQIGKAVKAGDMVAARRAAASGALATLTNTAILAEVSQGNITGNGPDDPAKKRALMQARDENGNPEWRPNSIRVGDQWVPYSSFGPVAVQLGAVANAVEQYNDAGKQVNPNVARAFGSALGDTIMDAWYLQTLSGVFSAVKNGTLPEWMGGQALSTAGRVIPEAGLANMLRGLTDPVLREPKPKLEDPSSWLDYFANRVPGASETVQPRLDPATGRPIEEPRTPASSLVRGTAAGEPNPVNETLARHNLGVGDAPDTISPVSGVTVAITEDEKRRFLELSGPEVEKRVLAMQNNPSFQKAPPDVQRDILQEVIQDGRDAGAVKLFQSLGKAEQVRRMQAYDAAQKRQAEPSVKLP